MSVESILKTLKDEEYNFVDIRFTDSMLLFPLMKSTKNFSSQEKCLMDPLSRAGKE
jgi:hypothetical protein